MDSENAVTTPVEETTPTESAPVETKTDDAQPVEPTTESPVEGNQPEKTVSETVPYERFKQVNDELRELKQQQTAAQPEVYVPPVETEDNPFDEVTTSGVMTLAEKAAKKAANDTWEEKEATKWVKEHAVDLKDRAVDSLTRDLIRQGLDRDDALKEAKKDIEGRASVVRKEALTEGVQEGQQLANKKNQMGAVGTTGATDKVDLEKLSADELEKFLNIPHARQ